MAQRKAGSQVPGILAAVGGLLAVVGSMLVWFSVRADTTDLGGRVLSRSVKGTEASDGKMTLIAGVVVIVAALVVLVVRGASSRAGFSALASVGGLVAGGLALYDVATAKRQVIDSAVEQVGHVGFTIGQIRALLERAFDTGILRITPGVGILLVIAGGALGLMGGIAGLFSPAPAAPEAAPTGEVAPSGEEAPAVREDEPASAVGPPDTAAPEEEATSPGTPGPEEEDLPD